MLTFQTVLPPLKMTESVASHTDKGNQYVRFTLKLRRFPFQEERFEVYVSGDSSTISIRYYYAEDCPPWAREHFDAFLIRMQTHIEQSPEFRLRFATRAMKLHVEGFPDIDEYDDFEEDITEMGIFIMGIGLGVSSLFEVFRLLDISVYGFLGLLAILTLGGFYAYLMLSEGDSDGWEEESKLYRLLVPMAVFGAITLAVGVLLGVAFLVSWILPYPLTFISFILCFFGYNWVIDLSRKVGELNEKYTSKS